MTFLKNIAVWKKSDPKTNAKPKNHQFKEKSANPFQNHFWWKKPEKIIEREQRWSKAFKISQQKFDILNKAIPFVDIIF